MAVSGVQNTSDIQQYVSQLMEYEKKPLYSLQNKRKGLENQISAWNKVNSSLKKLQATLDTLQKSATFRSMKTTSSNTSLLTATAGVNASETTYTFSNITLARPASTTSSASIGLLSGVAATITSSAEINTQVGQSANPNATIASGNINLDSGNSIVSGSFYVNNKKITVAATDTIYTILSKINSSGANVTATFQNDSISITQKTTGLAYSVRLKDDTTGFFKAMKLSSGSEDPDPAYGVDRDYYRSIANSALAGSVSNGYLNINNITIAVNVDSDSLSDIINRINSSDAGVMAYYDSVENKVTMTSIVDGQGITLSNDTSNLFSALNIGVQTYSGTNASFTLNGQSMSRSSNTFEMNGTTFTLRSPTSSGETVTMTVEKDSQKIEDAVKSFVDQHNETTKLLTEQLTSGNALAGNSRVKSILRRLQSIASSTVLNDGDYNHLSQIGISIDYSGTEKTMKLDTDTLADAIDENVNNVFNLFAINTDNDGRYNDGGLSVLMDNYIEAFTKRFSGAIVKHNDTLNSSITRLDRRIERMQEQMDTKEQRLIEQYQRLQDAVSKLDNQSYSAASFLNQYS